MNRPNLDTLANLRKVGLSRGLLSTAWHQAAVALMDAFPAIYDMAKAMNEEARQRQDVLAALRGVVQASQMHPVHMEQALGRARRVLDDLKGPVA